MIDYAIDNGFIDAPGLPGWKLKTARFDYGRYIGVMIWNGKTGKDCRRHAVRATMGVSMEAEAIRQCLPQLTDWFTGQS